MTDHSIGLETMLKSFRGLKIISTDPLVYEYYLTLVTGCEHSISDCSLFSITMVNSHGTTAIGMLAELNEELLRSAKANDLEVEWLGYQAGQYRI